MTEVPLPRTKTHASIRIDADVLEWFKSRGRGYQTRINAVLRQYYEHHREP
ncbi:BrnA antitoxin family protein [Afifella sp. H1R]|nr:BrnA antitoxin family protein [Afifella sp. H1R]